MLTPPSTAATSRIISIATTQVPSCCIAVLNSPAFAIAMYTAAANVAYLARRANVRNIRKRDIWSYRTTKIEGTPWTLYGISLVAWQAYALFLFPFVEPLARLLGYVSFMYDYPNARGFGYILEPLRVQDLSMAKRTKSQIRLDWHAFNVNVGKIGRDGYRHPPSVSWNLPHLDAPRWGVKHWPWRRRSGAVVSASLSRFRCDDILESEEEDVG